MAGTSSNSSAGGSLGFAGALTIAFIVLKLTGVIGWSWWLVLAPIWISAGLAALIVAVVVLIALTRKGS
ncbi:hypothetical protein ABZ671_00575 [Micromonospora sp. NPDC006766]|uniref:hypothetical protein n=1 Tax=Micromonospora sp. NPDC006766 TaxID=3154778 RepID=UPI0034026BFB